MNKLSLSCTFTLCDSNFPEIDDQYKLNGFPFPYLECLVSYLLLCVFLIDPSTNC